MRTSHWLVGLLCVVLAPAPGGTQVSTPPPARLDIEVRVDEVRVSGQVSSAAHENILRKTIDDHFDGKQPIVDVEVRPALPPGWALITDITLRALAHTRSATAAITPAGISIGGFTHDDAGWKLAAVRVSNNRLPAMTFDHDVLEISPAGSMNRQCLELFRTATRGRKIEFPRASADLGTAASPALDEIIQIAADCPKALIQVTGHTDSTGDETVNVALSQARAESVSAYLIAGGIAESRIDAKGAGSAEPLAEETSAQARQLNRRIEIDVRFP